MELRNAEGRRQNEEAGARLIPEAGVLGRRLVGARMSHAKDGTSVRPPVAKGQKANIQRSIPQWRDRQACSHSRKAGSPGKSDLIRLNPTKEFKL